LPRRAAPRRSSKSREKVETRYWSRQATERINALDLEGGVFTQGTARAVAESLKRSAEKSRRRKGTPFQSAMSMLNFYINRAGTNLSANRKRVLNDAKDELRQLFGSQRSRS
jgi:hypothetical protein